MANQSRLRNGHYDGVCVCVLFCSGLVPLHNACSYGHYEVTQLLIEVFDRTSLYFQIYFCLRKMLNGSVPYLVGKRDCRINSGKVCYVSEFA